MNDGRGLLRSTSARAVAVLITGALGLAAAAGTVDLVRPRAAWVAAAPGSTPAFTPSAAPLPSSTPGVATLPDRASDAGLSEAGVLLQRRAAAVLRRDRAGFLATVDPRASGFRSRQAVLFSRLAALRPRAWSYHVQDQGRALPAARRAALGGPAYVLRVTLAYRLVDDTRDVEREQHLTLVRRGGGWLLAADTDGATQRDLWDLGPVRVVRGARSVVIGATPPPADLKTIAGEADAAARQVDRVWGERWPRTVVVLVPRTLSQMATILGRKTSAGLDQVAAMTSGELRSGGPPVTTPGGVADRVVLNPVAFADFTELGRRVVLTHEVTHVATRASFLVAPALWVEEGFADYVAYLGSGLSNAAIAGDLLSQVRAGRLPAHLPDAADFDPSRRQIAPAYAGSWLAMKLIATDGGTRQVVAFYRAVTGYAPPSGHVTSQDAVEAAAQEVLGESLAQFEGRWRAYLAALGAL